MQLELIPQVSVKTPLHYFGGKKFAIPVLMEFFPKSLKELVSPFFGSGALELALTASGVRVHGYDKYPPIPHFWRMLIKNPNALCSELRAIVRSSSAKTIHKTACESYSLESCDIRKAAFLLLIYNASYNGQGFGGKGKSLLIEDDQLHSQRQRDDRVVRDTHVHYERISDFYNPLIQIEESDFRESLRRHPNTFCYADPPYPNVGQCYGDSPEYHTEFPHEELSSILHQRENWVLSYNDNPLIQELYPKGDFDWYPVKWIQASRGKGRRNGNDVVITPKGQGGPRCNWN